MRVQLKPGEAKTREGIQSGLARILKASVTVDKTGNVYVWRRGVIWTSQLPKKVMLDGATSFSLRFFPLGGPRCKLCKKPLLESEVVYLGPGRQGHKKCLDEYMEKEYGPFDTGTEDRK